ncbi:MAG: hypothetical protein H2169_14970 [Opitutus sp.]|nr:hypothetical protein [Opitutus sp.]
MTAIGGSSATDRHRRLIGNRPPSTAHRQPATKRTLVYHKFTHVPPAAPNPKCHLLGDT